MERLTFEGNFCDIAQCRELPCPYNGSCSQRKVWERLKAYEDTGLEPGQCENAKAIIESAFSDDTAKAERTRELLKADKDGRHGRWFDKGSLSCRCSECGCKNYKETQYCPNCGCKMDLEG